MRRKEALAFTVLLCVALAGACGNDGGGAGRSGGAASPEDLALARAAAFNLEGLDTLAVGNTVPADVQQGPARVRYLTELGGADADCASDAAEPTTVAVFRRRFLYSSGRPASTIVPNGTSSFPAMDTDGVVYESSEQAAASLTSWRDLKRVTCLLLADVAKLGGTSKGSVAPGQLSAPTGVEDFVSYRVDVQGADVIFCNMISVLRVRRVLSIRIDANASICYAPQAYDILNALAVRQLLAAVAQADGDRTSPETSTSIPLSSEKTTEGLPGTSTTSPRLATTSTVAPGSGVQSRRLTRDDFGGGVSSDTADFAYGLLKDALFMPASSEAVDSTEGPEEGATIAEVDYDADETPQAVTSFFRDQYKSSPALATDHTETKESGAVVFETTIDDTIVQITVYQAPIGPCSGDGGFGDDACQAHKGGTHFHLLLSGIGD